MQPSQIIHVHTDYQVPTQLPTSQTASPSLPVPTTSASVVVWPTTKFMDGGHIHY
ncbi:hypothetical protein DL95DRAFT_383798, partial [Leptodontidium sp. 2 PMI_412]